ncbi:MAG: hypothetical protein JXR91_12685 [Deltaproteobacteria bacterium]|nr:hypothetical protein [Deltaproteobacteria bacterium]
MIKKLLFHNLVTLFFLFSGIVNAEDVYVKIDPSRLESVSGKYLMIASYSVILCLLSAYFIYIVTISKTVQKKLDLLQKKQNEK